MSRTSILRFATIAVVVSAGVAACGSAPEPAPAPAPSPVTAAVPARDPAITPQAATPALTASAEGGEKRERGEKAEGGEHARGREGAEGKKGEEGEEGGEMIARTATWNKVRRGARLILSFNAERDMFVGTIVNTTERKMCAVRVEVHLKGGPELGPTAKADLAAGGTFKIELSAPGATVGDWTAHPEVFVCGGV